MHRLACTVCANQQVNVMWLRSHPMIGSLYGCAATLTMLFPLLIVVPVPGGVEITPFGV